VSKARRSLLATMIVSLCLFIGYSERTKAHADLGPYEVIAYEHAGFVAITKSWRLAPGMRQRLVGYVGDELNNMLASIRIGENVGVALFDEPHFGGKWRTFDASTRKLRFPMLNRTSSLIVYPKEAGGPLGIELVGNWRRQFFPLPELLEETEALYPYVGNVMDDGAESVRIFGNYGDIEAVLFEHPDFAGQQITLPGSERVDTDIYLGQYQMERSISALRVAWMGPPLSGNDPVPPIAEPVFGVGTATIDGVMSSGEWDNAGTIEFEAILPPAPCFASDTVPAFLYVMNDANNIYLGVGINQAGFSGGEITFCFDNDNDGVQEAGDDVLGLSHSGTFVDGAYHTACEGSPAPSLCIESDAILGSIQDGVGAVSESGLFTFYELSHPLDSADVNDFRLSEGDTVGFAATLWLSTGIQPALFIAAETRVVPVIGYQRIRISGTD